jgi:hypothetical protein
VENTGARVMKEGIRMLLGMGGDALAQDAIKATLLHEMLYTPLYRAAREGQVQTVRALVEERGRGALAAQDKKGDTPLHHAADQGPAQGCWWSQRACTRYRWIHNATFFFFFFSGC